MRVALLLIVAVDWLSPESLIDTFGAVGLIAIIFLESFIPLPLPGDSLLFTAGLLASQKRFGLHLGVLVPGCLFAAVLGNQIGYLIGNKAEHRFVKPDSKLFKPRYVARTHEYFETQGPKTVFLARFIPGVRALAPILAGVAEMKYRVFTLWNIIGGLVWTTGLLVAGWQLGKHISNVDRYLLPIVLVIGFLSAIPVILEYRKHRSSMADGEVSETDRATHG